MTVLQASMGFQQSMMEKAAAGAGERLGTDGFDIDSMKSQADYLQSLSDLLGQMQFAEEQVRKIKRQLEIAESQLSQSGGATRTQRRGPRGGAR